MKVENKNTNFTYYITDIRYRFIYLFISLIFTFMACYYYCVEIIFLFVKPFLKYQKPFIFTELTEALYITLKICTITSICVLFPFFCYMIWCFFIPSSFSYQRNNYTIFLLFWNIFFLYSILTIYYDVLPYLYDFLLQYQIETDLFSIQLEARINSYLSWSLKVLFLLSIFTQLPLICYSLYRLDILCPFFLSKNRKFLVCFFFLAAALLSPPEFITQILITMAFVFTYEFIIWLGFFHASCTMISRNNLEK